ncbi:MAG: SAM-dependent methyltransferase [Planctomycetota bacterium]|jgi:SAM-dependent methyltransferase
MKVQTTGPLPYLREELPLEDVDCRMCGKSERHTLSQDPPFIVVRCDHCEFVYVTPRIPESHLHLVYAWDYYESGHAQDYGYKNYLKEGHLHARTFTKKAEFVARHKNSGRVLEVGSAGGFFLKEMKARGFDVTGVEISAEAAEFSRRELGLENIHCCRLEDAQLEGPFDVIALWDVIEHVSDPFATLEMLASLIAKDGILVVQTQNIDSLAAKLLGRRWHHFKHLEHIYHFSPSTIERALTKSGFETVELTSTGAGKYISGAFVIERMRRLSRVGYALMKPFRCFGDSSFYVNLRDEFIVAARLKTDASGGKDGE